MSEKHVDEAVGVFAIIGRHLDGSVNVNDGYWDIFEALPYEAALLVVDAQAKFRCELYHILCANEVKHGKA